MRAPCVFFPRGYARTVGLTKKKVRPKHFFFKFSPHNTLKRDNYMFGPRTEFVMKFKIIFLFGMVEKGFFLVVCHFFVLHINIYVLKILEPKCVNQFVNLCIFLSNPY